MGERKKAIQEINKKDGGGNVVAFTWILLKEEQWRSGR